MQNSREEILKFSLLNLQYFKQFHYPPVFVQADHVSEIDKKRNVNNLRSADYGLKMVK